MDRKRLLFTAVSLVGLVATLWFLMGVAPSEAPTIEQVLARDDVAKIERIRGIFGAEPDVVLVAIRRTAGRVPAERLRRVEAELGRIEGVAHTWSSLTRPVPVLAPDGTMLTPYLGIGEVLRVDDLGVAAPKGPVFGVAARFRNPLELRFHDP